MGMNTESQFPFTVPVLLKTRKLFEASCWLFDNFGDHGRLWREGTRKIKLEGGTYMGYKTTFSFKNERDAAMFALMWA
jgi:hypothetical protein